MEMSRKLKNNQKLKMMNLIKNFNLKKTLYTGILNYLWVKEKHFLIINYLRVSDYETGDINVTQVASGALKFSMLDSNVLFFKSNFSNQIFLILKS